MADDSMQPGPCCAPSNTLTAPVRRQPTWHRGARCAALPIAAALLLSCGGGEPEAPVQRLAEASRQPLAQASTAQAARELGAALKPQRAPASKALSTEVFFDWAATQWPQFFPGAYLVGTYLTFQYRFYPTTGHFLAVSEGGVYVLPHEGQLIRVAPLSDFTCLALSNLCTLDSATAIADLLSQIRSKGGFATLEIDQSLHYAAQAHADYMTVNYIVNGDVDPIMYTLQPDGVPTAHYEFPGKIGFSGTRALQRAQAAGYTQSAVAEVSTTIYGAGIGTEPDMSKCLWGLLNTVYHRTGLLSTALQDLGVGIGEEQINGYGYKLRTCVLNLGGNGSSILLPSEWVGVFPYAEQEEVPTKMESEVPDPVPHVAIKGFPISVQVSSGNTLDVQQFSLSDSGGIPMAAHLLTSANDARLQPSEAYLVPLTALKATSRYTVKFTGQLVRPNSPPLSVDRTWSFTTR